MRARGCLRVFDVRIWEPCRQSGVQCEQRAFAGVWILVLGWFAQPGRDGDLDGALVQRSVARFDPGELGTRSAAPRGGRGKSCACCFLLLCAVSDVVSAAPNEVRVLTSPDGANMEEAACWRKTGKADDSFVETLEFNRPGG